MTVDEAARYLLLGYHQVCRLARKGKLKASKVGKAWVLDDEAVKQWKEQGRSRQALQSHPWRHGIVLGRQNWRCRSCKTLNTRVAACRKCNQPKPSKEQT